MSRTTIALRTVVTLSIFKRLYPVALVALGILTASTASAAPILVLIDDRTDKVTVTQDGVPVITMGNSESKLTFTIALPAAPQSTDVERAFYREPGTSTISDELINSFTQGVKTLNVEFRSDPATFDTPVSPPDTLRDDIDDPNNPDSIVIRYRSSPAGTGSDVDFKLLSDRVEVPEPSTLTLLVMGLLTAGVGFLSRRRQ